MDVTTILHKVGSAVVGGMLLGLIEGMGLLMNNFMSQQFRPVDPRCEMRISFDQL